MYFAGSLRPLQRYNDEVSKYFPVHPENPQQRSLNQIVDILHHGGLIATRQTRVMPSVPG
ncbi:YciO family [Cutibacterium acnes JCM 18918]|nr:YciO family [Cutibacterium acnes JCM 18918]